MISGTVNVAGMVNVNLLVGATFIGTAVLDGEGGWSKPFDTTGVADGPVVISATPVNGVGTAVGPVVTRNITIDNP